MKTIIQQTIEKCDLCGKQASTETIKYPVIFISDQTEGRSCKPYIDYQNLDLCAECKAATCAITAYGAQGLNTYSLSKTVRPSYILGLKPYIDGNMWCVLHGDNLQVGIAGFGNSPELAMVDFDRNWNTAKAGE